MFGLRNILFRNKETAQLEEMNRLGESFTDLARAGNGERAVHQFVQLVNCQPSWTQFHFDVMEHVVRREFLANVLHQPLQFALRDEPHDRTLQYSAGLYYQSLGNLEKAIAAYLVMLQLNKRDGVAYHNLGVAYRLQGNANAALDAWQKAVAFEPGLAEPHLALGIMLQTLGRKKEAVAHIKKFLRLANPSLEGYKRSASMLL